MKLLIYSDLHLEFGAHFQLPEDTSADLLVLAGDIITFQDFSPLGRLLQGWDKPVLYVAGNHEYYTRKSMTEEDEAFRKWIADHHKNVTFLQDEAVSIDSVHFFGGVMWTDFDGGDKNAMNVIRHQMNDFQLIRNADGSVFQPEDAIVLHQMFKARLSAWFEQDLDGPRVVISHHAPVINPNTQYGNSPLMPGFNSLDMVEMIEKYQPDFWIYGHTHECDDQAIGKTRIVSNQLGYPDRHGGFECAGFDPEGLGIEIKHCILKEG